MRLKWLLIWLWLVNFGCIMLAFLTPVLGWAGAGGVGSRGVLEVRCHEAPFVLEHGQIVGRLVYEKMAAVPDALYGRDIASNYQGQGLKLSKHFRVA